ncbi:MAG: hypothetical protein IKJ80_04090 [Clostridia bacterium]|nr:hypothetical protein [Clostridia bacterium]
MKNNKLKNSLLSVFIILVTAGIFLLLNKDIFDIGMCWFAFGVIMASELALAFAWVTFSGSPQRLAVVFVSFFQTIANIIASWVFIKFFTEAYIGFSVYTLLSFALLIVLAFFLYSASASSDKTSDAKDFFLECRASVRSAALSAEGEKYRAELLKLEESIRFCNDGISLAGDSEISAAINELKSHVANGSEDILDIIEKINTMLANREYVAKTCKR